MLLLAPYYVGVLLLIAAKCHFHVQGQLSVTSLPDTLFSDSSTSVVEGSVLWLYCEVNSTSTSLSVSWSKDGGSLVQDVPHIRLRTSTSPSSTTLLLVVDNVVSSDAGVYQCAAQDGLDTASGSSLNVAVLLSNTSGALRIDIQDPLTMISGPVSYSSQLFPIYTNRTAVNTAAMVTLSFTVGHVGDDINNYATPTAMWLKDGVPSRTTPTNMALGENGLISSNLSFIFQESDAGVYQCIFSGSGSMMYGTIPLRLNADSSSSVLERVSPPIVFLTPPEKLVLEVRASGGYEFISWNRVSGSFDLSFNELVNFHEVFVRQPTTTSEYGTYETISTFAGIRTSILVVPTASPSSDAGTSTLIVLEGRSTTISCNSSGGPVPTITWTLNNQPTNFNQTDFITNPTDTTTPGHVFSTLHIINAQYPTHDGVYTCTGTNIISGSTRTNSSNITVQVQVVPMVQVTAIDRSRVIAGETVTIACDVVSGGNPSRNSFTWYLNNSGISPSTTSVTLSSIHLPAVMAADIGMYTCQVSNDVGTGSDSISITFGIPPTLSISFSERVSLPDSTVQPVCSATKGDLPISFFWYSPNGDSNLTYSQSSSTSSATVDITPAGSGYGVYTCMGNNSYGNSSITFTIIQAVAPIVVNPTGQTKIPVGTTLSLSAEITTYNLPLTSVRWSFNNESLINGQDRVSLTLPSLSAQAPVMSSLRRTSVIPVDTGDYKLIASNPAGSNELSISVTVTAPASITEPSDDGAIEISLGSEATLSCEARGVPSPTIEWSSATDSISSTPISSTILNNEKYYVITSNLTIASILRTDTMFTCSANNSGGMQSRNFIITVTSTPITLAGINTTITISEGGNVNISCTSSGGPVPTIIWTLNSQPTNFSQTGLITNPADKTIPSHVTSTLHIVNAQYPTQDGVYICTGTSTISGSARTDSDIITVLVLVVPTVQVTAIDRSRVIAGENVTITCEVISRGNPSRNSFVWYFNNSLITLPSVTTLTSSSINLPAVMESDIGTYTCRVTNDVGMGNNSIPIAFGIPPKLSISFNEIVALPHSTVQPVCSATEGDLPFSFSWSSPNGTSDLTSSQSSNTSAASIDISPAGSGYGVYTCIGSNSYGNSSITFTLIQAVAPMVVNHTGPTEIPIGSTLSLSAKITIYNLPLTSIRWSFNNESLMNGQDRVNLTLPALSAQAPVMSSLQRTLVTPVDSGDYKLIASNPAGSNELSISVTVTVQTNITEPNEDKAIEINLGSEATLRCVARGVPSPTIDWSSASGSVNSTTVSSTIVDNENYYVVTSNLIIGSIQRIDTMFTCSANNSEAIQNRSFIITVTSSPSTVAGTNATIAISEGGNVNISCASSGGPVPTVTWTLNNQPTNFSQTDFITNPTDKTIPSHVMSTLHIVNAQYPTHDGVYTCIGTNTKSGSARTDTANFTVQVQVVPTAQVTAIDRSRVIAGENVTITCEVISGGNPSRNSFMWYFNNSFITPPSATTLTSSFINLPAVMESDIGTYTCRVINDVGTGNDSIPIAFGIPPKLFISFNETVALPDSTVRPVCSATEGDLPFSFSWSSPNGSSEFTSSQSSNISDATIDITPAGSGYGVYTCKGSNSYGNSNITFTILQAVAPMVVNHTGPTEISIGNTLSLSAEIAYYNLPLTSVRWSFNNESLINGQDRFNLTLPSLSVQAPVMSSLQRTSVIPVDSGDYKLIASNPAGSNELSISVTVTAPTNITEPSDDVAIEINLGSEATLSCVARGVPSPTIEWSSATGSINSTTVSSTIMDNENYYVITSNLTIASIRRIDTMLTCSANNSGGMQNRSFIITVTSFPSILAGTNATIAISEGDNVNISCISSGGPVPTVTWTLSNQTANFSQTDVITYPTDTTTPGHVMSTLHIVNAQYPTHDGVYTCTGTNTISGSARTDSTTITVQVQVVPMIQVTAVDRSRVIAGENVTITCDIVSRGNPSRNLFMWYFNNSFITPPSATTLTSSSINLPAVMESDIGTYTCSVTNDVGAGNDSIPIAFGIPPKLSISFNEMVLLPHSTVQQVCSATEGDLPFLFSWSSPNGTSDLTSSQSSNISDAHIDITPAGSGYGVYTCTGSNSYGNSNVTFTIIQAVAPMVVKHTGQTEIPIGNTLSLSAEITIYNLPLTSVRWSFNNKSLINGQDRVNLTLPSLSAQAPVMSSLQRTSAIPVDSGSYKLIASNPAGSNELSIPVTVTVPTNITEPSENMAIEISLGSEATLSCVARGVPSPTIEWSSASSSTNSTPFSSTIMDNEKYYVITSNLTIASILRTDTMFTCFANNSGGIQSRSFIITVTSSPSTLAGTSVTVTVSEGESVNISCTSSGGPVPTVTWTLNNLPTNFSQTDVITNPTDTTTPGHVMSILHIVNARYPTHDGVYTCTGTNTILGSVRNDSANITIIVHVFPAIASLILNRLLLASLHENVTVAFEISNINIASVPDITAIQWFYITHPSDEALAFNSSNLLNFTNSVYRSNDHTVFSLSTNNLSLTIYNVTMENQGRYYLRAENSKGNSNSDYVDVIIKENFITRGSNSLKMNSNGCPSTSSREDILMDSAYLISSQFEISPHGLTRYFAALSCEDIKIKNPKRKNGYYWIKTPVGEDSVYCDFS